MGIRVLILANKTRRGDIQRYNIFITPFEIIFFKMSGTGEYVKNGDEANKFFGSIQFKEYKPGADHCRWLEKIIHLLMVDSALNFRMNRILVMMAAGYMMQKIKPANTQYRVIRTDIHNYQFC